MPKSTSADSSKPCVFLNNTLWHSLARYFDCGAVENIELRRTCQRVKTAVKGTRSFILCHKGNEGTDKCIRQHGNNDTKSEQSNDCKAQVKRVWQKLKAKSKDNAEPRAAKRTKDHKRSSKPPTTKPSKQHTAYTYPPLRPTTQTLLRRHATHPPGKPSPPIHTVSKHKAHPYPIPRIIISPPSAIYPDFSSEPTITPTTKSTSTSTTAKSVAPESDPPSKGSAQSTRSAVESLFQAATTREEHRRLWEEYERLCGVVERRGKGRKGIPREWME